MQTFLFLTGPDIQLDIETRREVFSRMPYMTPPLKKHPPHRSINAWQHAQTLLFLTGPEIQLDIETRQEVHSQDARHPLLHAL